MTPCSYMDAMKAEDCFTFVIESSFACLLQDFQVQGQAFLYHLREDDEIARLRLLRDMGRIF